jgi:hypothetical protein
MPPRGKLSVGIWKIDNPQKAIAGVREIINGNQIIDG